MSPGFLCEREIEGCRERERVPLGLGGWWISKTCATLIRRQQQLMQHLIIRVRLPCHPHYIRLVLFWFFFFLAVLYPICHTHCYISYPCARCVALLSVTSSLCSRVQCKQTSFAAICYVFLLWRLARAASSRFQTMHLETRP